MPARAFATPQRRALLAPPGELLAHPIRTEEPAARPRAAAPELPAPPDPGAPLNPARMWKEVRRQTGYLAAVLAALIVLALALGAVAAGLQAGRNEARNADLAFVVAPAAPPDSLADDAFELYRRGYVRSFVLVGEGQAGLKARLVERGVPEASLLGDGPGQGATAELRRWARQAAADGAASALVVTDPPAALQALKVVRDQGLRGYGVPSSAGRSDPVSLLAASAGYWRYVLLGR